MTTPPSLMDIFDFTPEDLAANRVGQLSEMQRYRLKVRFRRSVALGIGVILGLAFVATLFLYLGNRQATPALAWVGLGVTVCSAAIMGNFTRSWLRLNADIRSGTAQRHHGTLERVVKPVTRRVVIYLIRVDGAEFNVGKDAFKLFKHQATYTTYRAPYSGQLLSVEAA